MGNMGSELLLSSGWSGTFSSEGPLDAIGITQGPECVSQVLALTKGENPDGQDVDHEEEGSGAGDTDCHDTHPNADSRELNVKVYSAVWA